jgi:16S rRNA (guanine1207-N2)-methyltransferase
MSEHYYSARPGSEHELQEFAATLRGRRYRFQTDRGVFSRDRVDFGSELLIETVRVGAGDTLLDLGCGYGPVGVALAHEVARVHMVEINERAANLARENLKSNGVANAVVHVGDGVAPVQGITFDHVCLNPPIRAGKATVFRLLAEAYAVLAPGGRLWVVIQNKQGAPSTKKELARLFGQVEDVERKAGYHIFLATKPAG